MARGKVSQNQFAFAPHNAAQGVQANACKVELREPAISKPFYAVSCWIKTAAAIGGAL